jgi:hypothetical protein
MDLPRAVAGRRVKGESDIEAQWTDGGCVAHAYARRELQVAYWEIEGAPRDLPKIEKDRATDLFIEMLA